MITTDIDITGAIGRMNLTGIPMKSTTILNRIDIRDITVPNTATDTEIHITRVNVIPVKGTEIIGKEIL